MRCDRPAVGSTSVGRPGVASWKNGPASRKGAGVSRKAIPDRYLLVHWLLSVFVVVRQLMGLGQWYLESPPVRTRYHSGCWVSLAVGGLSPLPVNGNVAG